MMKTMVWFVFAMISLSASAQNSRFCSERASIDFGQVTLASEANRLSFKNQGGLINGGVCWWHSRFTRNATYLARFRPDLSKPSLAQARSIIHTIRLGRKIVDIPGYSDLETFSIDFQNEIQTKLEQWQRSEGVGGAWIRGLRGRTSVAADKLATMMDELYQRVAVNKEVVYQKLQLPGITAHAWLVIDVKKEGNGYLITVVDSNYLTLRTHRYTRGSTHMLYGGKPFVPYIEYTQELTSLQKLVTSHCSR